MLRVTICIFFLSSVSSFPDPGQYSASYYQSASAIFGTHKPLFAGSSIHITVKCEGHSTHQKINLQWVLRQTSCYEDYLAADIYTPDTLKQYFMCPMTTNSFPKIRYFVSQSIILECSDRIHLEFVNATFTTFTDESDMPPYCEGTVYPNPRPTKKTSATRVPTTKIHTIEATTPEAEKAGHNPNVIDQKNLLKPENNSNPLKNSTETNIVQDKSGVHDQRKRSSGNDPNINEIRNTQISNTSELLSDGKPSGHIYGSFSSVNKVKLGPKLTSVDMDGIYLFILKVDSIDGEKLNSLGVDIAMKGEHGYLSAIDYPLLIFYGVMCGLYVIYAIAWLVLSALQWRDLLRIQFWIGAVILLGLMEKAVFYAEYQSINFTGQSVQGAILFAEILSCMKRTLARMLIIIVSLGFGIVKPRLGPTLHRIVGVGTLYFCLGTLEGCLRVLKPKTDPGNQALMAGIPLAVTDSGICWWIFSSLVQTIRTLRLRRNIVKLQLYRHFTNTLVLSVIGSVCFMTWSIHAHKLVDCITDWKELWVDEAYWHFLFSTILFVIMILWRPTNNNQRYAFTPLLDAMDDEDDDEDSLLPNDAYAGMKMRSTKSSLNSSPHIDDPKTKEDDNLKWVEDNIPASLSDVALPSLMDSDEEIMTAKFERSKME